MLCGSLEAKLSHLTIKLNKCHCLVWLRIQFALSSWYMLSSSQYFNLSQNWYYVTCSSDWFRETDRAYLSCPACCCTGDPELVLFCSFVIFLIFSVLCGHSYLIDWQSRHFTCQVNRIDRRDIWTHLERADKGLVICSLTNHDRLISRSPASVCAWHKSFSALWKGHRQLACSKLVWQVWKGNRQFTHTNSYVLMNGVVVWRL